MLNSNLQSAIDVLVPRHAKYTNAWDHNPKLLIRSGVTLYEFCSIWLDTELYDVLTGELHSEFHSKDVMRDAGFLNGEMQEGPEYYSRNGGWIIQSTGQVVHLSDFSESTQSTINRVLHGPYGFNTDYADLTDEEIDEYEDGIDVVCAAEEYIHSRISKQHKTRKKKCCK